MFLATANENYCTSYGSAEAEQPSYDAATVLLPLRQGHEAVAAKLGVEVANPEATTLVRPVTLRNLLNDIRFLGPAIAILVLAIGWALVRRTADQ